MTHCILSPETATSLFRHASMIRDAVSAAKMVDFDQLSLDLGTDQALEETMLERSVLNQAIEEFMDEREDLIFSLDVADAYIASLQAENATLRRDVKALESAAIQAANFVDNLRAQLASFGVTFTSRIGGHAELSIDAAELTHALYSPAGARVVRDQATNNVDPHYPRV